MFLLDGKFEVDVNCVYNICLFELSSCTNKIVLLVLMIEILEHVLECQEGQSLSFHLHSTYVRRGLCCCCKKQSRRPCLPSPFWRHEQQACDV